MKHVSRSEKFQRRLLLKSAIFVGMGMCIFVYKTTLGSDDMQSISSVVHEMNLETRRLEAKSACNDTMIKGTRWCGTSKDYATCTWVSEYPQDAFTHEECQQGAVVLHFIGMFYMFMGLSIICDEFFVPALEEMTFARLKLSPDVAGATFMAAGGSAPELATSFIGTFTESTVGFGTSKC